MAKQQMDYQTMSAELDDILMAMQADDIDVDEAMQKYERGLELVAQLEAYLQQAENTVTKLAAQHGAQVK